RTRGRWSNVTEAPSSDLRRALCPPEPDPEVSQPLLGVVLLCVLVAGSAWGRDVGAESVGATYVGRAACAPCHAQETAAHAGSHHDRAMQPEDSTTVLGNFDGYRFTYAC